jgi:DNA polymerase III delta prime subunit
VVKASKGEDYNTELDFVCNFYNDDVSRIQLETQLPLLQSLCADSEVRELTIHDIVRILAGISSAQRVAFSSVWTAM